MAVRRMQAHSFPGQTGQALTASEPVRCKSTGVNAIAMACQQHVGMGETGRGVTGISPKNTITAAIR
jgi:hypothetical protein